MIEEIQRGLKSPDVDERRSAVLRLKGGGALGQEEVIALLLEAMRDGSWRVRKTAQEILLEEYPIDSYIKGLLGLLYVEDNAGARNAAIETLTVLNKKSTPYLIEAFETPNNDVRKFIIDVLGQFRDKRAMALMVKALKDEDENVMASAIEHLGTIGDPSVMDAIVEILQSEEIWTAYPAADALGRIGDKKALPALIKALERKPLREPVLKAIGNIADPGSLDHIVSFLQDKSGSVQEEALKAMEMLYHKGVQERLITDELKKAFGAGSVDIMVRHAWSSKPEVRVSAILMLGLLKDESALVPLLELSLEEEFAGDVKRALTFIGREKPEALVPLFDKQDPYLKRFVCEVAEDVASVVFRDKLKGFLKDEDGHVRAVAARGLANIGKEMDIALLKEMMADNYADVQDSSVAALAKYGDALDIEEFMAMLKDGNPVLRTGAANLLGKLKALQAVPALGFALKDGNVNVRRAVVGALSNIGTADSVKHLSLALTDEDTDVRSSAALSLGMVGEEGAIVPLCLLLNDPDDMVKVAAIKSLGMLRMPETVGALIKKLSDENGFVVTTAIGSLGRLGGPEAHDALAAMLGSADGEIARTAIKAISGFEGVQDLILPFLRHEDWATRVAAVEALATNATDLVRAELEKLFDEEEDPAVKSAVKSSLNV